MFRTIRCSTALAVILCASSACSSSSPTAPAADDAERPSAAVAAVAAQRAPATDTGTPECAGGDSTTVCATDTQPWFRGTALSADTQPWF
jgi:hypothetical protein